MQEVDRLGWAATTAFAIGPWTIGIRSNTAELDALLRATLAAHVVDGVEPPPNYSISLAGRAERGVRPLSALYWKYTKLIKSPSPVRVAAALLGYLGDHHDHSVATVRLPAMTFVGPQGAVCADPSLGAYRHQLTPRLRRLGVQVVDSRWAHLDDQGALIVPPPRLHVDGGAWDDLRTHFDGRPRRGPDEPVKPGRYGVRGCMVRVPIPAPDPSPARAVSLLLAQAPDVERAGGQRTLDALVSMVRGATVRRFLPSDLDQVEAMLRERCA